MIEIKVAQKKDAASILTLQKRAYQKEAQLYDDYSIPPLTQTIGEIVSDFNELTFFKAKKNNQIVGSVRVRIDGENAFVGRLVVEPHHQGQGIGTRLMTYLESQLPECSRFELFTGHKSEDNIRLYERLGYRRFKEETVHPGLSLVYMEKIRD